MKYSYLSILSLCTGLASFSSNIYAADNTQEENKISVAIRADLTGVTVNHKGKDFRIMRNQDTEAVINPQFAKTSRTCPPFCIQPISLAPGVETLGEIEVLDYLSKCTREIRAS